MYDYKKLTFSDGH